MAGLLQLQRRRRGFRKTWTDAVELSGKPAPRLQAVELGERGSTLGNGIGLQADLPRHGQEDAPGFRLLFFDQPHQFVVLFDGLERFQVNGLSAGRGAMHHPGNAPLMLRFDRNDEAFPANSDQLFLGASPFGQPAQRAAQALFNRPLLALDLAADSPQITRGAVAQRASQDKARSY